MYLKHIVKYYKDAGGFFIHTGFDKDSLILKNISKLNSELDFKELYNCISSENYSELLLFIISSLEDKKWTDLHPEHLRLILEGIKKYKDGKIFNKIIMEIISENNII